MKKITEKRQYSVVKEKEVDVYQTSDGRKFDDEVKALEHENFITQRKKLEDKYKMRKINTEDYGIDYSDSLISSKLIYIEELNEETKKDLAELYPYLSYYNKYSRIISGWNFFIETEYDSNCLGKWSGYDLYIYNLDEVIKEKEEQLKKLKEIK